MGEPVPAVIGGGSAEDGLLGDQHAFERVPLQREHEYEQEHPAHTRDQLALAQTPEVQRKAASSCIRAACTVLRSSIAGVIGPTPPGTGVIRLARSTT